jgi:hypothetical protein
VPVKNEPHRSRKQLLDRCGSLRSPHPVVETINTVIPARPTLMVKVQKIQEQFSAKLESRFIRS